MPVARYVEKYGGPTVSDAWAKSRAASRFDRPGAREAQAKVIADLNRTDEFRERSKERAAKINERYASDPAFKVFCDAAKKEGWDDEARAKFSVVASKLRLEEWKDAERYQRGVQASRKIMTTRWKNDRETLLQYVLENLKKADTPEARKKLGISISAAWKSGKFDHVTFWGRHKYKGYSLKSTWELIFAKFLDVGGLSWKYEPTVFSYEHPDGSIRRYKADFWVEEWKSYIEVHPEKLMGEVMERKLLSVKTAGFKIRLLTDVHIDMLRFILSELGELPEELKS
jgi:hypothetical protein